MIILSRDIVVIIFLEDRILNKKLMECLSNPVMCRLLIEIEEQEQATAKKLAKIYPDIPQATLYRYLSRMLKDDVLKVVEENKIRGTIEKVYALNYALEIDKLDMLKENAGEDYFRIFTQYAMGIMREFQEYTERSDINIPADGSGFWSTPLYLSKKEVEEVAVKIQDVLNPLLENTPTGDRQLHNIDVIITPPKRL